MATVRALSIALLLALCFGACACACAAAAKKPKYTYISYAAGVSGRNGHSRSRIPPGCERSYTRNCPDSRRLPTEVGATTAAAGSKGVYMMNHAALPSDDKTKAGAKTGAAESKARYISPAALNADRPCGWCARRPGPRP